MSTYGRVLYHVITWYNMLLPDNRLCQKEKYNLDDLLTVSANAYRMVLSDRDYSTLSM